MNQTPAFRTGLRRLLYPALTQTIPAETDTPGGLSELLERLSLTIDDYQTLPLQHRTLDGRAVDVAMGEVILTTTDVSIPGPVPLDWGRYWRSGHLTGGSVGTGWRHAYDYVLLEDRRSQQVVIRTPDSRALVLPLLAEGESAYNRLEKVRLGRDALGYRLRGADGLIYRFADNPSGSLCRLAAVERTGVTYRLQFTYNQLGYLIRISDGGGRVIELTSNAQGQVERLLLTTPDATQPRILLAHYRYDEAHNLTEAVVLDKPATHYHYRQQRVIRLTDSLHRTVYFGYTKVDGQFRCTDVGWGTGGRAEQIRYFLDEGRTLITDEAGNRRQYIHEAGVVQRFMSAEGRQRIWFHNEYNELLSEQDPLGNTTFFAYDDRGNQTQAAWPDGGTLMMTYGEADELRTLTDRAGGIWQWTYDAAGRLLSCLDPLGAEIRFTYNATGLLTSRQGGGQSVRWEYDGIANPIRQLTATGQTIWTYDALGPLPSVAPSMPEAPTFAADPPQAGTARPAFSSPYLPTHDADGRLIRLRRDRLNWQFIRDAAGSIREYIRPDGQATRFHYNAAGRLTEVLFSDGSWCHYAYRPDGWLIEAATPTSRVRFERDARGRVLLETADDHTIQMTYDLAGHRTSQQILALPLVTYAYENQGWPARLTHPGGVLALAHDRQGRLTEQLWPGGLRSRRQYDIGRRPLSQSIFWGSQLQAGRLQTYGWAEPQLLRTQDSRYGTVDLRYDRAGEVIEASCSAGWTDRWAADRRAYQQRLLRPAPDTAVPGWQQLAIGAMRFYYDADGYLREKRVAGQVWQFHWHESGTLEQVVRPDRQLVTFTYDALGRQRRRTLGNRVVRWLWDGRRLAHEWHQQGDDTTSVSLTWWYGDESAVPVWLQVDGKLYSVVCNELGHPLSIHAPSGEPVWEYGWYLFGKKHGLSGPTCGHTDLGPGQFDMPEAGLVYARFRYYDADTGLPLSPEYSSPAGWAQAEWAPPHAPESFLSVARCIRAY